MLYVVLCAVLSGMLCTVLEKSCGVVFGWGDVLCCLLCYGDAMCCGVRCVVVCCEVLIYVIVLLD